MAPASAIATRNAAKNAIIESDIHAITDVEYSGEDVRKWKRSITAAAKNIPSKAGGHGGAHGHACLAETITQFRVQAGVNSTVATNPGLIVFTTGVAPESRSITMAQEQEDHEVGLETFYTQEGVSNGLCKVIIDSAPEELLVELEDDETGFNEVDPKDMIAEVMANATPATTLEAIDLTKRHNAALVFDTEAKLSLQLKTKQRDINDLHRAHQVEMSEAKFMAKILNGIQEEGGEDFEDEAAEWKTKTTNNALTEFKVFFVNQDNVVRNRDKHTQTKAKDSGFHSANSAKKIKATLPTCLRPPWPHLHWPPRIQSTRRWASQPATARSSPCWRPSRSSPRKSLPSRRRTPRSPEAIMAAAVTAVGIPAAATARRKSESTAASPISTRPPRSCASSTLRMRPRFLSDTSAPMSAKPSARPTIDWEGKIVCAEMQMPKCCRGDRVEF